MIRASITALYLSTTDFTPDFLSSAAEKLSWDATPKGQQKRQVDLALLGELLATTRAAESLKVVEQRSTCSVGQLRKHQLAGDAPCASRG